MWVTRVLTFGRDKKLKSTTRVRGKEYEEMCENVRRVKEAANVFIKPGEQVVWQDGDEFIYPQNVRIGDD